MIQIKKKILFDSDQEKYIFWGLGRIEQMQVPYLPCDRLQDVIGEYLLYDLERWKHEEKMIQLIESVPKILSKSRCMQVSTSTGTGKSTKIPAALANAGFTVWVSVPTTVAARALYEFVRKQQPGLEIGLAMDGTHLHTHNTQLLFGTTQAINNMILRMLAQQDHKQRKLAIVMDEFHHPSPENRQLAYLCEYILGHGNPLLHVLMMSATPVQFVCFPRLASATSCDIQLPTPFPIQVVFEDDKNQWWFSVKRVPVHDEVISWIRSKLDVIYGGKTKVGDTLVFVAGETEIKAMQTISLDIPNIKVVGVWSGMDDDDRALLTETDRKQDVVFVATNIAETGITLPNVSFVVDSCLQNRMIETGESGHKELRLEFVPKSATEQRKGRTGRTGPGTCFRLLPAADFDLLRPAYDQEWSISHLHFFYLKLLSYKLPTLQILLIDEKKNAEIADRLVCSGLYDIKHQTVTQPGKEVTRYPFSFSNSVAAANVSRDPTNVNEIAALLSIAAIEARQSCQRMWFIPKKEMENRSDYMDDVISPIYAGINAIDCLMRVLFAVMTDEKKNTFSIAKSLHLQERFVFAMRKCVTRACAVKDWKFSVQDWQFLEAHYDPEKVQERLFALYDAQQVYPTFQKVPNVRGTGIEFTNKHDAMQPRHKIDKHILLRPHVPIPKEILALSTFRLPTKRGGAVFLVSLWITSYASVVPIIPAWLFAQQAL